MIEQVFASIRRLEAYQDLIGRIKSGAPGAGLGLQRSVRLALAGLLRRDLQIPILWVTDRTDRALVQNEELAFWCPQNHPFYFPEPNPLFYEQEPWSSETRRERLQVLTSLARYHIPGVENPQTPPLIVTPIRALMTRTLPRRDFLMASKTLRVGQVVAREEMLRNWFEIGYETEDVVTAPGECCRRGGILDVWPPAQEYPIRIDLFGDEVDTLRLFDPATQRTIRTIDQAWITPAKEVLRGKGKDIPPEVQVTEFLIPRLHPTPASLLDYLPRQSLILVDDFDPIQQFAAEVEEQAVRLRSESIQDGLLDEHFPLPYLTWSELYDTIQTRLHLEAGRSTAEEVTPFGEIFSPGARFGGRLKSMVESISDECRSGRQVYVISRQVSRLQELWEEKFRPAGEENAPGFFDGTLGEGWLQTNPDGSSLVLLTDSEIFGWDRPQPRQRGKLAAISPEALYADLKPGDWVVHVDYGVGRFTGLVRRTLEGTEREFLCVEYEAGDQLFVPIHQADRLSRYIGPDGAEPSPTRLGSAEWLQVKQHVREAVRAVAQDLLELYARRQVAQGFAFSKDAPWLSELEGSFPYIETEDQVRAIRDVKQDMENLRPMDRLLCGDVGYGKTEVALRAAFKAVLDGKQVAVLVPTTVLAQQHFETFRQRLAPYPVTVEMLSRFRMPKVQDEIIRKLLRAEIDIVIGTHRLLQQDVQFKDLGLVIIDEEQRFGVTHKEFFKKLRTEVDVLTLTATPIPRTLYMALTGVRDISTINTPPAERQPIITHIGPYSPRAVRQAVLRELERGGQVFFVHNRVQTIDAMRRHLEMLVPEARVGIGHGQMPENELAEVMTRFTHGDIDILLCTSIIESGLDIPNANTLIVDRADAFGLAQLYQLRGRVGRGAQRAYAYFFRHRKKAPTPEGQERLEVIAENTQLGSGYSIAMRDLEMRGAGDLLGTRQHGYIAAVGFQLYTRMLGRAVRELRQALGLPAPKEEEALGDFFPAVTVDLPLSVGLPVEYVQNQSLRLQLYRRLANLRSEAEVEALSEELADRFGPLPESTGNLLFQIRLKLRAEKAGLVSITVESQQLVLRFPPQPENQPKRALPFIGSNVRAGKAAYWTPFDREDPFWQDRLLEIVDAIIEACPKY